MASNFSSSPAALGASFFPLPIIALRHTHTQAGQGNVVFLLEYWLTACADGNLLDYPHYIPWAPLKEKEGRAPAIN